VSGVVSRESSAGTTYEWRGLFASDEVERLHAEGFVHEPFGDDWWGRVNRHSLGWVCARDGAELVGFVNVAWDGSDHAFVLDTLVTAGHRRRGVGTAVVAAAAEGARAAGCTWLHVDFEPHLVSFYSACGFVPTDAGLIALQD
jgi:GNAT superfamily N-acetyltransferase